MTIKEFLQWVIEHRDYAPLYSSLVATGAFVFSVLSFVISGIVSKNRVKKDKIISDARYEEQRKQYEERLSEERKRREEDFQVPHLTCSCSVFVQTRDSDIHTDRVHRLWSSQRW